MPLIVDLDIGCKSLLLSVVNNNNITYKSYDVVCILWLALMSPKEPIDTRRTPKAKEWKYETNTCC